MSRPDSDATRDAVLAFIEEERAAGREPGRRDIAKAFRLDAGGKIWLKRLLRELELAENGGASPVKPHAALPAVLLCEVRSRDREGDLIAVPPEWNEADQGEVPKILVERQREFRRKPKTAASAAPGIGDQVYSS